MCYEVEIGPAKKQRLSHNDASADRRQDTEYWFSSKVAKLLGMHHGGYQRATAIVSKQAAGKHLAHPYIQIVELASEAPGPACGSSCT